MSEWMNEVISSCQALQLILYISHLIFILTSTHIQPLLSGKETEA